MSTRSNRWTRWNRSQHNNYDYDDGSWSMVGKGQRKSKWGQDPWWDQAFALDARITQACAKQVAQALHLSLDGKGGKKGKGKGKGDKGDGAGKGDKVTQGQGWACSACQLWHTNPTCTSCRKCGVEHAVPPPGGQGGGKGAKGKGEPEGKGKGKGGGAATGQATAAADADATMAPAAQADAAGVNPMKTPKDFIENLDTDWRIPEPLDDDDDLPPLTWEIEDEPEPTPEQLTEQANIKSMIAKVKLEPDTPLREKILQELVAQLLPTKPVDYFTLPGKEQSEKQLKLIHYEAEWNKRFAERRVKADKAVEEAHKRLTAAQQNLEKVTQERQMRYEEETTVKARMVAIKAYFFKEEPPAAEGFATPAKLAAKVSPQQVQLLTAHTISRCDPAAQEFAILGVTPDQVKTLYLAFAKEMVAEQGRITSAA